LAVKDWRLRRWRLWFLALSNAPTNSNRPFAQSTTKISSKELPEKNRTLEITFQGSTMRGTGSCHKRQKTQAPTPQEPIRNRQTRKVANAKVRNSCTNLTYILIGLAIIWRLRTLAFAASALSNAFPWKKLCREDNKSKSSSKANGVYQWERTVNLKDDNFHRFGRQFAAKRKARNLT